MRIRCIVAALLLTCTTAVIAGPYYAPPWYWSLAREIDGSKIAILVEWVSTTPADGDQPGTTQFQIVNVIRDTTGRFQVGNSIEVSQHQPGESEDQFLLLGKTRWLLLHRSSPQPVSEESSEYILQIPAPDIDQLQRLRFFADHLEHADALIADDAFSECAVVETLDIGTVADLFDAGRLRQWLADEQMPPQRVGLYGLLLGQLGNPQDADFLKQEIERHSDDVQSELRCMISGYLTLTGESGLPLIEDAFFTAPDSSYYETYSAMRSLRFIWTHAEGVISRERLRESMRILLDRPDVADLAITDLARWQDWSVGEQLMDLYGAEAYDLPSIKQAIVRYYLVAKRATGEDDSTETSEHVLFAEACLEKLRKTDPDNVLAAERFFFLN